MPAAVLHDVLSAAARRLRDAGLDAADAGADVEVLARHVLGWDRARLLVHRREDVPASFVEPFTALVDRRADRVPVAYLTGTREFYGLDFEVTPDVLIPRPETELAVEAALEALASPESSGRVVDVGTGSGCIAVAIAVTRRDATILAIDRSPAALAVAARNVRRHGVAGQGRQPSECLCSPPPHCCRHRGSRRPAGESIPRRRSATTCPSLPRPAVLNSHCRCGP